MRTELNAQLELLNRGFDRFPFAVRRAYADWLAQSYYYVRHSTRLLAVASGRFGHDAVGDKLHHRFAKHMAEENKHEQLCVHDLKVLGASIVEFPEHASTRMFYEPQYYKVEHVHPAALLGYILPLEAVAISRCAKVHGIVTKAFEGKCGSFLHVHAEDDPDHLEKAFAAVESLPVELHSMILENMEQTTQGYLGMLEEIRRKNA